MIIFIKIALNPNYILFQGVQIFIRSGGLCLDRRAEDLINQTPILFRIFYSDFHAI